MKSIQILNIPNFYSSYYLLGLSKECNVTFKMDINFIKFNNRPILIFIINDKLGVIDNDDPSNVIQELYNISDSYFVTNKHIDVESYSQEKVKPLYPHYPINILALYLNIFGINLFRFLKLKQVAKEIYNLLQRPFYEEYKLNVVKGNFVFFSSRLWKKESETNLIRAEFIRFCKEDSRIEFKGGFMPRSDGNNMGFDKELNQEIYSPKMFSQLSSKSKVVLNNAAVGGAVSWRLAEYLNQGLFVLSFPLKIALPTNLNHADEVHLIENTTELDSVFNVILENETYHNTISSKGKQYFDNYCTPIAQAHYIIDSMLNTN